MKPMKTRSELTQRFTTNLVGEGGKVGIVIPAEVVEGLAAGKRPAVAVTVNGYEFRYTVAVMGGQYMIGVNKEIRETAGLHSGDTVDVTLRVDNTPREIDMPDDFAKALAKIPKAKTFFEGLSNSLQRYHVGNVEGAKTQETRQRRIDKAIELFLAEKQR